MRPISIGQYPSGWYDDIYEPDWDCKGWSDIGRHAFQHYNQIINATSYCTKDDLEVYVLKFDSLINNIVQFCDSIVTIPALRDLNRSMFLRAAELGIIKKNDLHIQSTERQTVYEKAFNNFFDLHSGGSFFRLKSAFPTLNNSRPTFDPEAIP